MKTTPVVIARSLVDIVAAGTASLQDACDSAIVLLHRLCPGTPHRAFLKLVEREVRRRGGISTGMLMVPNVHSVTAAHITEALQKKTGTTVHLEREVEPELIGGAVLLVDHLRIDCSVQGALKELLAMCLEPLA